MLDSPYHEDLVKRNKVSGAPLKLLWSRYKLRVLHGIGITIFFAVVIGFMLIYLPTFLTNYGGVNQKLLVSVTFSSIMVLSFALPVFGWLCDKCGGKVILIISTLGFVITSDYCYSLLISHSIYKLYVGIIILSIGMSGVVASVPIIIMGLFPTRVRFSGAGLVYNFCAAFLGGFEPLLLASMGHFFGSAKESLTILTIVGGCITLISSLLLSENKDFLFIKDLRWKRRAATKVRV
jgi:MFS family permease